MGIDILGRELKENDLVVAMAIGKYSRGMKVGLWNGSSVTYKGNCKSKPYNIYLINNPDEEELKIKEQILSDIKKEEDEVLKLKLEKKLKKKIPNKEIKPFNWYEDDNDEEWLYLGYGTITTYGVYEYTKEKHSIINREGYIYVQKLDDYDYIGRWSKVLKNPKKLVEKLGKAVEPFEELKVDNWNKEYFAEINLKNN